MKDPGLPRCGWALASPLETAYHDSEWGVPSHDDVHLFEMLILEGAQAGLSWRTILNKRPAYRDAYEGFDPERVARFGRRKQAQLLENPGIVRNRLKIAASIDTARAVLDIRSEHGSLAGFVWTFVDGRTLQNRREDWRDIPAQTDESRALSKALKLHGCRFVGPTICYAFMQAVGMVNDHVTGCYRQRQLAR
jgi:DNA-3-methyladenine glycosylase I